MFSYIYKILPSGHILEIAGYSLPSKQALVAYIMQYFHGDYNTWQYPTVIAGMQKARMTGNWFFDADDGSTYVAAKTRLTD